VHTIAVRGGAKIQFSSCLTSALDAKFKDLCSYFSSGGCTRLRYEFLHSIEGRGSSRDLPEFLIVRQTRRTGEQNAK